MASTCALSARSSPETRDTRAAMGSVLEVLRAYARSRHHPFTPACVSEIEDHLADRNLDMCMFSNEFVNEPVFQ